METLVLCSGCMFKHSDVLHLRQREPSRHEYKISSSGDMNVRVVKSGTATIKIPELGVTIKPSSGSRGYISNVEGVLNRVKEAIVFAMSDASPARRRVAERKLKTLGAIMHGLKKTNLIVMDPFGHSAIIDKRAKRRKLTKKELAFLEAST